jgi:hypothetical protein
MSGCSPQLVPFSRLFEELLQRRVNFALFKGLDQVDAVLGGADGDIDILLEAGMRNESGAAFSCAGFHQDLKAIDRLGEVVKVYRAFDPKSTHFVMVHAYEQLRLGDRMEFRYGQEADLLSTSMERDQYRVVAPDYEWVIRAFNDLAKGRFDDPYLVSLGYQIGMGSSVINDSLYRYAQVDFADTLAMFNEQNVEDLTRLRQRIFGPESQTASSMGTLVQSLASRVWAARKRTLFSLVRTRNKMGFSCSIALQSADEVLIDEVATQIAAQLAPVALVKRFQMGENHQVSPISWINDRFNRLKVALGLKRGMWVVLIGAPSAFPVGLHVRLDEDIHVSGIFHESCSFEVRDRRPRAIASLIIEEGLRHRVSR